MKYKCPVCGGDLVKGFCVRPESNVSSWGSVTSAIFPLKNQNVIFRLRARVCSTCGHVDLYVHPDDISKFNS